MGSGNSSRFLTRDSEVSEQERDTVDHTARILRKSICSTDLSNVQGLPTHQAIWDRIAFIIDQSDRMNDKGRQQFRFLLAVRERLDQNRSGPAFHFLVLRLYELTNLWYWRRTRRRSPRRACMIESNRLDASLDAHREFLKQLMIEKGDWHGWRLLRETFNTRMTMSQILGFESGLSAVESPREEE